MQNKIRQYQAIAWQFAQRLQDVKFAGQMLFVVVVLLISWSGVKAIQSNYDLQKKISTLKQENDVLWLQNSNTYLQNQYYKTDQYLELSARQNLGFAAPGEHVLLVPKGTAAKYVDPNLDKTTVTRVTSAPDNRAAYVKNIEAWRDFILGRSPNIK